MGIEAKIDELVAALNRNTEALAGAAAPAGKTKTTNTNKKTEAPKVSQDEVNAALLKLKEAHGIDEAKAIVKKVGKVDKMGEIKPADYKAVYDAAVARFEELEGGAGEEDTGDAL